MISLQNHGTILSLIITNYVDVHSMKHAGKGCEWNVRIPCVEVKVFWMRFQGNVLKIAPKGFSVEMREPNATQVNSDF